VTWAENVIPDKLARYRNPPVPLVLGVFVLVEIPVAFFGAVLFGVPYYFGWFATVALIAFLLILVLVLLSFFLFASIEIEPGRVVFHALFWRYSVLASEVARIELDPPVTTLSMEMPAWGRTSKLVIHRSGRHSLDASFMPDGLKLRIAHALAPGTFSLPDRT